MMTPHKTMLSPAPGFTARVMTRITAYERVRARQRVLLGALLFGMATVGVLAPVAFSMVWWTFAFVEQANGVATIVIVFAEWFEHARVVLEACWVAVTIITRNVNDALWVAYALLAVSLTMLWTRLVIGFPRFASNSIWEEKR